MIEVGSQVEYTASFLRFAGICTGPIPFARGTVTAVKDFGPGLAVIDWDTPNVPERVLIPNLKEVGVQEPN